MFNQFQSTKIHPFPFTSKFFQKKEGLGQKGGGFGENWDKNGGKKGED